MQHKNICLVNDSFPPVIDGVSNAVVNYAQILHAGGCGVTVVTPAVPEADDAQFPFPVVRYPSVDMTKLVGYRAGFPFSAATLDQLQKMRFDLIHCHCPITSAMLARSLRDQIGVPLVFTYHTKFDIDIANAIRSKRLQAEAKKMLVDNISACDEVWTVSHGAGKNLESLGYKGAWRVMPNGVDFPKGRVDAALVDAVAKPYDLPRDVPVFLFVGRMMWYKGLRTILDALKLLKSHRQAFRMVFVGSGGDRDEVMAYSHELGLDDCVFFDAPKYDRNVIRAWYCRADLFLFPSTFDTNGLVVREAAACALGSVLIRGSCAAEDVEDGVSGFFIEENAASMADQLLHLCQSPEAMRRVGKNAQQMIYISWQDAVARASTRYDAVIANYRAGQYPTHTRPSDEAYRALASYLAAVGKLQEKVRDQQEKVLDQFEQLADRFL